MRQSASRVHLRPAITRRNLRVETHALTSRVTFQDRRANGVVYSQGGAERRARARREAILSGGSYNSPQVLLLSGVGPAKELSQMGIATAVDLPGVGRNLSEHMVFHVQFLMKEPITFLSRLRADRVAMSVLQWALFGAGDFATQALTAVAFLRSRSDLERPDIQLFFNSVRMDAKVWFPGLSQRQEHMLEGYPSLNHPESRGDVRLASANPNDPPLIRLNALSTEGDRATARECIRLVGRIYGTKPLADLIVRETSPGPDVVSDADLDAFTRRTAEVGHHPVGTCAIGARPEAVVNSHLRVRGLEGLHVVNASVMPSVPGGNTNAPTIMIAERAADLIRGRPTLPPAQEAAQ